MECLNKGGMAVLERLARRVKLIWGLYLWACVVLAC